MSFVANKLCGTGNNFVLHRWKLNKRNDNNKKQGKPKGNPNEYPQQLL
jgi:hypothetical protein